MLKMPHTKIRILGFIEVAAKREEEEELSFNSSS